ncbi:MAG: hypothetical protein GX111_09190 [Clostridiales bacterium]|jgi:hypothetical protein|nr:hypothetical protein [Clostridiales bacterium]
MSSGKRKIIVVLLALSIMFTVFVIPVSAADVIFLVINDNLPIELNDATMPVNINGTIYVPYWLFSSPEELGTSSQYFIPSKTVLVSKGLQWLKFDLKEGKTTDNNQNEKHYKAITNKGTVYLPVDAICAFFSLTYSYIYDNQLGPIVRIKPNCILSDSIYINLMFKRMQSALNTYLASTPATGNLQFQPTPTPPDYSNVDVYIAVYGIDNEKSADLLSLINNVHQFKVCFFVTAQEIKDNAELIREMIGTGHSVGLLVGTDVKGDYLEASQYLKSAAEKRTLLVASIQAVTDEMRSDAQELGLVFWFDGSSKVHSTELEFDLAETREALKEPGDREDLIFKLDENMLSAMEYIFNDLKTGKYHMMRIRETQMPCLSFAEQQHQTEV